MRQSTFLALQGAKPDSGSRGGCSAIEKSPSLTPSPSPSPSPSLTGKNRKTSSSFARSGVSFKDTVKSSPVFVGVDNGMPSDISLQPSWLIKDEQKVAGSRQPSWLIKDEQNQARRAVAVAGSHQPSQLTEPEPDLDDPSSYKSDDYHIEYYMENSKDLCRDRLPSFETAKEKEKEKEFDLSAPSAPLAPSASLKLSESPEVGMANRQHYMPIYRNKEASLYQESNHQLKMYCTNCGKMGHNYKKCVMPTTSIGIFCVSFAPLYFNDIIYYIKRMQSVGVSIETFKEDGVDTMNKLVKIYETIKTIDEVNYDKIIRYLMVQRKHSICYVEFIRGKYDIENIDYIYNTIQYMTNEERVRLMTIPFQTLWIELWHLSSDMMPIAKALCNVSKENREKDYQIAKEKFESLKKGIRISRNEMMMEYTLENLIKMSKYEYRTSEWGFPKGRRNMREKNIDCANREFQEETNLKENDYQVVNLSPIEEVFRGINGTLYKHIYYISQACRKLELKMDKENYHQVIEIGNIQWFTLNQSLDAIREYNIEKRNLIINTHNMLKSIFFLFKELLVNLLKGYKGQKE